MNTDSAYGWNGEQVDLDSYFARIGFDGPRTPALETLRALQWAHVATIPFENVDIQLGRTVQLDLDSVHDKLVTRSRGGYCLEQTVLFAAVLERLGFKVTGLSGRARMDAGLRPATHALLKVELPDAPITGQSYLCDIGFGDMGPLEPIEITDGNEVLQGGWHYRLARQTGVTGNEEWVLYTLREDGWYDLFSFTLDPRYAVDYDMVNYHRSTHPGSRFVRHLLVQQPQPDARYDLTGTTLTVTRPDGAHETRQLEPTEVPKVLDEVFGVRLPGDDATALVNKLAS
ncbi:arylamine N-acetyltransferase [Streptomyces sp. NPDC048483]|uniref:arylamine N-acetyltransferase family protein n=1 Tax=Streptomyces sp. NPDC048483 TaxID=3154927 RepID=UPI00342C0340